MKFDYESVNDYCIKLEKALVDIREKYDACDEQINRIKNSDLWAGPAATNFITKSKSIIKICRKTEKELNNIIKYIKNCSQNYENAENNIIKEIQSGLKE